MDEMMGLSGYLLVHFWKAIEFWWNRAGWIQSIICIVVQFLRFLKVFQYVAQLGFERPAGILGQFLISIMVRE